MPDRETPYGDDSDYLRKLAYHQEAEVVREDLVNYFSSSPAMDGFRTKLEEMIDQSLRTAVNEAMKDRNIQDTIRNELVTAVISKMKEEILKSQPTIISSMREGMDKLTTAVRADIAKIYQQARDAQVNRDASGTAKAQGESVATPTAGAADASAAAPSSSGTLPVVPPQKPPIRITLPTITLNRQSLRTSGVVSLLILVAVLITYFVVSPKKQRTQDPEPAASATPGTGESPTPTPSPSKAETLDETWARILAEAGSLTGVQELKQAGHLQCWFNENAQRRLSDLLDPQDFPLSWQFAPDLFDQCVLDNYALTAKKYLPILASQIAVHKLLETKKGSGWNDWCDEPEPTLPELSGFADGKVGETTSRLLNTYLACSKISAKPRISTTSPSQDYLITLYAALKDLGHR